MIQGPILPDQVFVHLRTGNEYILAGTGLMKQGDGEWVPSVVYHRPGDDQWFTRDEAMFRQNFSRIEDEARPNDPHDDLTPGADATDRAGVDVPRGGEQ